LKHSRGKRGSLKKERQVVDFGKLVIYEFTYILGDHPNARGGAPLSIGWKHNHKNKLDVDYYEDFLRQRCPRKSKKELLLKCVAREALLRNLGHSAADIEEVSKESEYIMSSRLENMKDTPWETFKSIVWIDRAKGYTVLNPKSVAGRSA
jgi:hypothetical protein